MLKTITNIDGTKVIAALNAARPVTAAGKVAVENFKRYMQTNRLYAIALENALETLSRQSYDVGLESLIATLKGLIPAENRQVAIAYENIANENKAMFYAAGTEAEQKVAELYKLNGDKIIESLVSGELDAYATNPAISKLIAWAKAARVDQAAANQVPVTYSGGDITVRLVPVLNLTMSGDAIVASIDKHLFVIGKRGQLNLAGDLSDYDISTEVQKLITVLDYLKATDEPNIMTLVPEYAEVAEKQLSIKKFEIDLLANNDAFIGINGTFMSYEKAEAILNARKPEILAATLLNDDARRTMQVINEVIRLMADFRGSLLTNLYAKSFEFDDYKFYIVKNMAYYNVIVAKYNSILAIKSYNDVMDVIKDDFIASNPPVFNAVQNVFAADIDNATSKMNVRIKIADELANDIAKLESLHKQITQQLDDLGTVVDANPEKEAALKELRAKTEEKLDAAKAELQRLA